MPKMATAKPSSWRRLTRSPISKKATRATTSGSRAQTMPAWPALV